MDEKKKKSIYFEIIGLLLSKIFLFPHWSLIHQKSLVVTVFEIVGRIDHHFSGLILIFASVLKNFVCGSFIFISVVPSICYTPSEMKFCHFFFFFQLVLHESQLGFLRYSYYVHAISLCPSLIYVEYGCHKFVKFINNA